MEQIDKIIELSKELSKKGLEVNQIKFNYKIENNKDSKYWKNKLDNFQKYSQASTSYYNTCYSILKLFNLEESQTFLLKISKYRQFSRKIIEIINEIIKNPAIMDTKDMQQSKWSKESKINFIEIFQNCLKHEKDMNSKFNEFFENNIKEKLSKKINKQD
jgi:uncharacterized protein YihD (DUF1040 family)